MKITTRKTLLVTALTLVFAMGSVPLFAAEAYMGVEGGSGTGIIESESSDVVIVDREGMILGQGESETTSVGIIAEQEKLEDKRACFYDWEINALGERMVAACVHPRHNRGGG